jgi:predicted lipoprotein with Yx(FWY)xxD motif
VRKLRVAAAIPVALSLVIAGCGSSSKKTSSTSSAAKPASSSSSSSGAYGQPASTPAPTTAAAAVITTKHDKKLGAILAYGPKRLTVYLFEGDKGSNASCVGACAAVWPAVIGKPQASGAAMGADLGTITRADGKTQVTYKGHPLYLFARDKDNGDAYGQGLKSFGASWYVLKPSGVKVDLS